MKLNYKKSISLTLVAVIDTALGSRAAFGAEPSRCTADLGRVDTAFCVGMKHKPKADASPILSYEWQANDATYNLSARLCLDDTTDVGSRRNIVFALDRSQNIFGVDALNRKLGADQLTATRTEIEKLRSEATANPSTAPKVAVLMFSTDAKCSPYNGAAIAVNRTFPCLYTKAATLSDDTAYATIKTMLKEAEGKYAEGGLGASSDLRIPANLAQKDAFAFNAPTKGAMLLMTDALSYLGADNDPYAYLRSSNYAAAETSGVAAFAAQKAVILSVALSPVKAPTFDQTHADSYDTMCALAGAAPADCSGAVNVNEPSTWPVNKIDLRGYATKLVAATGGPADLVFEMKDAAALDSAMEKMRANGASNLTVTGAAFKIGDGDPIPASLDGQKLTAPGLPTGQDLKVSLILQVASGSVTIPVSIATKKIDGGATDFTDKEMFCAAAVASASSEPKLNLDDLQGGSASCGRMPGTSNGLDPKALLALFMLPLLVIMRRKKVAAKLVILIAASTAIAAQDGRAASNQGLNLIEYRPVLDGNGNTEKATTLESGKFGGGVFMDYSNDAVELGGDKGKRLGSVMDNSTTAHAVMGLGLGSRFGIGAYMPYVHRDDLNRALEGVDQSVERVGRPSDGAVMIKANLTNSRTFSFGVMPMVTLPTGEPSNLSGDGVANYGLMLLTSGEHGAAAWAASAGYLHRDKPLALTDDRARSVIIRGQVPVSLGLDYKVFSQVAFGANVQMKPSTGERLDFSKTNPAEWSALAKAQLLPDFQAQAGFGTGIGKGIGSPDYRVFAGIAYVPSAERIAAKPMPATAPGKKTAARK